MPHFSDPSSRGDFWAEVKIQVPAVTDDYARTLLEDLKKRIGPS
jgi:hypothetical protein